MSKRHAQKRKERLVAGWAEVGESRSSYAQRHGVLIRILGRHSKLAIVVADLRDLAAIALDPE